MSDAILRITNKELCYTAMMLRLGQLVNVEYLFPVDEASIDRELDDVKRSLRNKKLLKENAKGEITLDMSLIAVAKICSVPDHCEVKEADKYYATIYNSHDMYLLIEREPEDVMAASWFDKRESLDDYIAERIKLAGKGNESND